MQPIVSATWKAGAGDPGDKAAVSYDSTTAFQPGQKSKTSSLKTKIKK